MKNCIVKRCPNNSEHGKFIGDICVPCYSHITTGIIGPTDSFLGVMKQRIFEMKNEIEKLKGEI